MDPGTFDIEVERRENREPLKTGISLELGQAMTKRVIKNSLESMSKGKHTVSGPGFTPTEIKSMKEYMRLVFKQESGLILIQQERKI